MEELAISFIVGAIIYWGILAYLGYLGYKRTTPTAMEYFLAGGTLGPVVVGIAGMATMLSAWTMLGHPGGQYTYGLSYTCYLVHMTIQVLFPLMLFYKPLWLLSHKYRFVTIGEMAEDYFESKWIRVLIGICAVLFAVGYVTIQLVGGAIIFQHFSGGLIYPEAGAILMAIIVAYYVIAGGFRSTVWTDVIQGILLILGVAIVMVAILWAVGGINVLWIRALSELPSSYFKVPPGMVLFGVPYIITMAFANLGIYTSPQVSMIYAGSRDPRAIRVVGLLMIIVASFLFFIGYPIIGTGGRLLFPKLPSPDRLPLVAITTLAPAFIAALFGVATLAAMNSTADMNLLQTSGIFVRDIISPIYKKSLPDEKQIFISRMIILLMLLLSISMVFIRGLYELITFLGALGVAHGTQMIPILFAITRASRITKLGAGLGLLAGIIAVNLTYWVWRYPFGIHSAGWGLITNIIVCIIASYTTKPPSADKVEKFHGFLSKEFGLPSIGLLPKTSKGWAFAILVMIYMFLHAGPLLYLFEGIALWIWNVAMWIFAIILALIGFYKFRFA
ncbi:MAG: sodium:solute symporter family protein [Candidatus Bathyarchaeia archaeon]